MNARPSVSGNGSGNGSLAGSASRQSGVNVSANGSGNGTAQGGQQSQARTDRTGTRLSGRARRGPRPSSSSAKLPLDVDDVADVLAVHLVDGEFLRGLAAGESVTRSCDTTLSASTSMSRMRTFRSGFSAKFLTYFSRLDSRPCEG